MKKILLSLVFLSSIAAFAGEDTCHISVNKSKYIEKNYNNIVTKLLSSRNLIEDSINPEFKVSFVVGCWGGCGRPNINPDELNVTIVRVSDGKVMQDEYTSRIFPESGIWAPSKMKTLKKLLTCEELRNH